MLLLAQDLMSFVARVAFMHFPVVREHERDGRFFLALDIRVPHAGGDEANATLVTFKVECRAA